MKRITGPLSIRLALCVAALVLHVGCDSEPDPGMDSGSPPGTDGGTMILEDGRVVPVDGGGGGADTGVCVPRIEICGDRVDQNCDGRDTSCGDTDGDGIEACREGDDLTLCDCDDSRTDVRPPFGGGVAGAPELCDGRDNDCNGRVDESAECCAGCASLDDRSRADVCTEAGACDCTGEPGEGPCASGETCCVNGCTDTDTDFDNCGFCGAVCTVSADSCVAGECACGAGPVCDLVYECTDGSCG